jgi:tetratricopeptide (TPR) repeat protein
MTELTNDGSIIVEPSSRFERSKRANELRHNGKVEEALPLYRELLEDESDSYSAAGFLHCLRKLRLFDEALSLCTPPSQRHMLLDWYKKEVIWTLIQGKLAVMDDTSPLAEVVSVAESILALEPKDYSARWRTVHPVLKKAGGHKQWNVVLEWTENITPDELSTEPMKDDRERDGWCERAVWHNYRIRSMVEVGDKEQAIKLAIEAASVFPRQSKFFKRLEALAQLRLGRFVEAELLYRKLANGGRTDWWVLKEYAYALQALGKYQDALVAMSKAALSNRKLEALVSLFSDIGFLCRQTNLNRDARNHLLLSIHIREKHGWAVSQVIRVGITQLNQELSAPTGPEDFDSVLAECQRFWRRTVGAHYDSRDLSLERRGVKRMLRGKLRLGPPERPYCFLHSGTRESYFCLKSDLPNGVTDGVTLQFDAMPSFDSKKNQESWKAVNVRNM